MTKEFYKTNLSAEAILPNESSEKLEVEITNSTIFLRTPTASFITLTHEEFKELVSWVGQYEKASVNFNI